ncbi:MAG: hypothetical protein ACFB21_13295, partial [Opitutales bacterium]
MATPWGKGSGAGGSTPSWSSFAQRLKRPLGAVLSPTPSVTPDYLDTTLVSLSDRDPWTIRDACEGVKIFGGIGSGKTSGSGATLARSFLEAGFGGLVLTYKSDECALWQRYAAACGRQQDLVVFAPGGPWQLNFLDYEGRHPMPGVSLTLNLVQLFEDVCRAGSQSNFGSKNEEYWKNSFRQLLSRAIDLIRLVQHPITLPLIKEVIDSAPT